MIAGAGVGQAATTVTESVKEAGSQGARSSSSGAGTAEDFENLLQDGGQGDISMAEKSSSVEGSKAVTATQSTNATQAGSASGNVNAASPAQSVDSSRSPVQATDNAAPSDYHSVSTIKAPSSTSESGTPGDRMLSNLMHSVDKMRTEGKQLLNSASENPEPSTSKVGAAPETHQNAFDLMKNVQQAQHDVTKLEVGTTILSKGVQSFDQDIQTLIKGGSG